MNLVEICSLLGILDGVLTGLAVGKEHGIWGGVTGAVIGLVVGTGSICALHKTTRVLGQTVFTHPLFHTRFERKYLEWVILFLGFGVQIFVNLVYLILVACLSGYATYFLEALIAWTAVGTGQPAARNDLVKVTCLEGVMLMMNTW